ncbi:MAG TPA: hypothetical protein VEB60_01115 [Candidatus Paceibacterota bacterium]|nr:hypothetical protein [Candidatus Paceibacterota bacterium]
MADAAETPTAVPAFGSYEEFKQFFGKYINSGCGGLHGFQADDATLRPVFERLVRYPPDIQARIRSSPDIFQGFFLGAYP